MTYISVMQIFHHKKNIEKKLAQITVFQIMLILSLPSYAQIIKKTEPSQIYAWMGSGLIASVIILTYAYKKKLKSKINRLG